MKTQKSEEPGYRGNFFLILVLLILLAAVPVVFLYYGIRSARKNVLADFRLNKSNVWDMTTRSYNRLLFDSIPSLSYYRGNLDSTTFAPIASRYLNTFPFLDKVDLYNLEVNNHIGTGGLEFDHLNFKINSAIHYDRYQRSPRKSIKNQAGYFSKSSAVFLNDCSAPLLNFSKLVARFDSSENLTTNQLFKYFYQISDRNISYLSIPQKQELKYYREMMENHALPSVSVSSQNLILFRLNPFKLPIVNNRPDLYQQILIRPLAFDSLTNNPNYTLTSIALPRAFSEYQLYFISTPNYLFGQAIHSFLPQLFLFIGVYFLIGLIGWLIFRNLNINKRLFKLQYDFINNFTHEFKTPVSVIRITGESLRSDALPEIREIQVYGKILEEEADKLNSLMNRLLSFTQIENKVVRVILEELNLDDFFEDLLNIYGLRYPDFQIQLKLVDIHIIRSDKVLLNSVFTNLMDNAYKYSFPDRKTLKIEVSRIKKGVLFKFIDEGIGIKNSEIGDIFKKFYKVENEFNVQGSVGIGLALCKQVVELLNGEISVSSKLGKGTEFLVKLPDLR